MPRLGPLPVEEAIGAPISWVTTDLHSLGPQEVVALVDLIRAWYRGSDWSPAPECNLGLLWEYVERHGLGGIAGSLAASGRLVPDGLAAQALQRYWSNVLHYEQSLIACRAIESAARRLGILVCFIKGPALVPSAYQDSGLRSYGDIDILLETQEDALRLIEAVPCTRPVEKGQGSFMRRLDSPGKIEAFFGNWELEFFYPVEEPLGPFWEFISPHTLDAVTMAEGDSFRIPHPNAHLILLIQHLALHLCSRFIWFCDIAAFIRHNREQLDFPWITKEMDRLQMRNITSVITHFCSSYIGEELPTIVPVFCDRLFRFQSILCLPERIAMRDYGRHQGNFLKWFRFYMIWFVGFFLLMDPGPIGRNIASNWTTGRLIRAFRLQKKVVRRSLDLFVRCTHYPVVAVIVSLATWPLPDRRRFEEALQNKFKMVTDANNK